MAYGIKYTVSYKRTSNSLTTIDILESNYTGSSTELTPQDNPLEYNYTGDINNIFQPSIGSGATINIFVTPLALIDLFTVEAQKFIVKIYDNNGQEGDPRLTLQWQGFLNTGYYSEDYSTASTLLTPMTLTANDGMAELDKIQYRPTSSTLYSGKSTLESIFMRILGKLKISFTYIHISTDLCYNGQALNEYFFSSMDLWDENFVDESSVPMTCRKVLDAIVGAFGLVISFKGDTIYIIDPISLHTDSRGYKLYFSGNTIVAQGPSTLGGYLDLSTSYISWWETGVQMDIVPQSNQVEITYNPYTFSTDEYDFANKSNWASTGSWQVYDYVLGGDNIRYELNRAFVFNGWTKNGTVDTWALKETGSSAPEPFVRQNIYHGYNFHSQDSYPYIIGTLSSSFCNPGTGSYMKLSFDTYVNTKHSESIYTGIESPMPSGIINKVHIGAGVKINGYYLKDDLVSWDTPVHGIRIPVLQEDIPNERSWESTINDAWTNSSVIFPINDTHLTGSVNVFVSGYFSHELADVVPWTYGQYIQHILLKNFKVEVTDAYGKLVETNDVKYTGVKQVVDETVCSNISVDTLVGCGPTGFSKASLFDHTSGYPVTGIYHDGSSAIDNANIVLQSYISQYYLSRVVLKGKLNASLNLSATNLYLIKDSNQLGTKAFYIVDGTYNDRYEYFDATMVELTSTLDTVNLV